MSNGHNVYILTNLIAPYYRSIFQALRESVFGLRIFVSTPMEANRSWKPNWGDLSVQVQKAWTLNRRWRHPQGFSERSFLHIPYDTLPLLIRHRPDVVISAQLGIRTMQAALYRKLFPRSRLIIWLTLSEHTEMGLARCRVFQRRALLAMADAVLVNGASGANYASKMGVPRHRVFPLPYCADINGQLKLQIDRTVEAQRRFLSIGQLTERKGLVPFLTILSRWVHEHPEKSWEFWIAGDGPMRSKLERFPAPPELRLRFLGNVDYENLPEVYAQGGIFVFPTLADEWGVVVNEALAAGLPVLGSRYAQAVEELIEDGINGWTFRPDHPDEMYAALDRAMTVSEIQLYAMRCAGRERIRELSPEYGANCFLSAIKFVRQAKSPLGITDPGAADRMKARTS